MSLFTGTATYYRQFRPGIPQGVVDILDAAAPGQMPRRLLDIGTGTGLVVEALLRRFDDVIGIDNDSHMLEAAEAALRPQLPAGTSLTFAHSSAEQYEPPAGWKPSLVTICRTFHWLDQPLTLQRLDKQVAPGGVVAILGDNSFWEADGEWEVAVRGVIQQFLGPERRAGSGTFHHHNRPYREILRESPFGAVEEMRVPVVRTWTLTSILGYLYSTSFAAPHLFGDRLGAFEDAISATLQQFSDNDTFGEANEFRIRLGRRPA